MQAYEIRAAVILLMAKVQLMALLPAFKVLPPSKWVWSDDHVAAFRAYADRYGYRFSQQPDFGIQSAAVQQNLTYVVTNEVRKMEADRKNAIWPQTSDAAPAAPAVIAAAPVVVPPAAAAPASTSATGTAPPPDTDLSSLGDDLDDEGDEA